jgi:predicted GNAT family acetyltransferase
MAGMCEELLREGKRPCLFYDDPAAAAVYHKLGFVPFGEWLLLRMEKAL